MLVASMDLDKIEERSQIGPRRRNDLPQGLADRDFLGVLASARVERWCVQRGDVRRNARQRARCADGGRPNYRDRTI
jgi:hypothetical protein